MKINYSFNKHENLIIKEFEKMVIKRLKSRNNVGKNNFHITIGNSKPKWYFSDIKNCDEAIMSLYNRNLITFKPKNGYITLITMSTSTAYSLCVNYWINLPSIDGLIDECNKYQDILPIAEFKCKLIKIKNDNKSFKKYLSNKWFIAIKAVAIIENLDSEVLERDFSEKAYGDSKAFNAYKSYIYEIYNVRYDKDTFFTSKGIVKMYYPIFLKGKSIIKINSLVEINLSHLTSIGIDGKDNVQLLNGAKVLTIENYASFTDCNSNAFDLIIYTGGFCNENLIFLLKGFSKMKSVEYYHWSDLDVGGFNILKQIRSNGIDCKSFNMDYQFLQSIKEKAIPIDAKKSNDVNKYLKKLEALKNHPFLHDEREVIEYLIKNKIWFEQESYFIK